MEKSPRSASWPLLLTLVLVIAISVLFIITFFIATGTAIEDEFSPPDELTDDTYVDVIETLLVDADAANGEILVTQTYQCSVCHIVGAGQVAPGYELLSEHVLDQRPPLIPAAYIYESIVYPAVHLVEGYNNLMPADYGTRLSDRELGDILAYLIQTYVTESAA